MKDQTSKPAPKISLWLILLPGVLLLALLATGAYIWRSYRGELMRNQEEQLLLVTQTAGRNLEITFSQYRESLELLGRMEPGEYRSYLEAFSRHAADVCRLDGDGAVTGSGTARARCSSTPGRTDAATWAFAARRKTACAWSSTRRPTTPT